LQGISCVILGLLKAEPRIHIKMDPRLFAKANPEDDSFLLDSPRIFKIQPSPRLRRTGIKIRRMTVNPT
jgi:hypothetical protein